DGSGFNVGIQNPRGENSSIIAVLKNQSNKAVVTSGDYQNYYIAKDNIVYSHIIDPSTLFPANHYYSVTIAIDDSGLADCLSTALFVLDYNEGLSLIEKIKEKYDKDIIVIWISGNPLSDSSIQSSIDNSQYITVTDNFKDQIVTD
ncbi:MAG: FAD:protein FMN transferase, partial [Erysipelotrichaceae bacterium]